MKRVTRLFDTLEQAEKFLDYLYAEYSSVTLTRFPVTSEYGLYTWEVE